MKKNLLLYILLFFLIIVNGFFLYNHLGKPDGKKEQGPKDPMSFVIKELGFDDAQVEKLKNIDEKHRHQSMRIDEDVRILKDALFNNISNNSVDEKTIDSIASLIGLKEKEKDKEAFYHFRSIQEICNVKQKEKLKKIIKESIHRGKDRGNMPPPPRGKEGHRPPPKD